MEHLYRHGPCQKNQNFLAVSPVYDGCLEYMSSKESLSCEACGCHRNFHEKVICSALHAKKADDTDLIDIKNKKLPSCKKREIKENEVDEENMHECKRLQDCEMVLGKLRTSFDGLQKLHPESHLDLQYVENAWRVWCGVCRRHLRSDKSGKSLHNIRNQHFITSKHKKNLRLILQDGQEKDERQKRHLEIRENQLQQLTFMK